MYKDLCAVSNRRFVGPGLWTAKDAAQDHLVVHGPAPPFIHTALATPPAKTWVFHRIHRPYDDDETSERWIPLRVPGDERLKVKSARFPYMNHKNSKPDVWLRVSVALRSIRTSVKHCCVAVSTHVCRRAGYR